MDTTSFGFPFCINPLGQVASLTGEANLHAKIMQLLLTAPGERVMQPEFGCGLHELVFDPNNELLAATTEFTIAQALEQWLGDEILVESVEVAALESEVQIEIFYVRRDRMQPGKLKLAL